MDYSFECGACHSIYKLDENQITIRGVKITCPKCLNYFILKKGLSEGAKMEAAYLEYVVEDGVSTPTSRTVPPKPVNQFIDESKTELIIGEKTEKIPIGYSSQPPITRKIHQAKLPKQDFQQAPYPVLKRQRNKAVPYLLVILLIVGLLYLYWNWL